MSKARDVAEIISTPPSIYSTDAEVAATYLTQASASTTYLTQANNRTAFKNLIINGAMQVAQRGTSTASITSDTYATTDRWRLLPSSQGTWTMSVENDAPTGSGFRKSTKVLCTTADASPGGADYVRLDQRIEGQNLQVVKKGTAAAEQLTISFWVKANVTGTYIVSLYDVDNNRVVSKSYTINASATWEYKTITFPADTTGAFDNDNALSLSLSFGLGAGSNYTSGTLQQTWAANTAANRFVGQVNLASAISNYWQVTGVQLEVGDTATPFEFLPYDVELLRCFRYFYRVAHSSHGLGTAHTTSAVYGFIYNPVPFRTNPNVTTSSMGVWDGQTAFGGGTYTVSDYTIDNFGCGIARLNYAHTTSGLTQYRPYFISQSAGGGWIALGAEL
jgi:hypothetical protein